VSTSRSAQLSRTIAIGTFCTVAMVLSVARAAYAESARSAAPQTVGTNLLANPSFEVQRSPWVGTRVNRVPSLRAPQGSWVALVSSNAGRASIDDWPGEVTDSSQGTVYTASMQLATARRASWNHPVHLVVREHDQAGNWVRSESTSTALRWYFTTLTVSLTAIRSGDVVDVYAYQDDVVPLSAFLADDASLVATPPPPPPPPPSAASSTLGLLAYDTGQPGALGDTSRYAYVVVQENQFAHIAAIKQANPNTKVLAYMQAGNTHYYDSCPNTTDSHIYGDSYGVSYCWANRFHPDWFLTDSAGNRLHTVDYSFLMPMDVGNSGFADAWASGTYANLAADGFDGVWMDDVNIDPGHGLNGRIAKYTDQQYGAATTQFAATVGDYLRGRGMIAIANIGMEPWVSYQRADALMIGQHLTAVNREHWARYGDICGPFGERFNTSATNGTPPLSTMIDYGTQLQNQGTGITGVDYGNTATTSDDEQTMTYGRALFLLTWNGAAGSAYFYRRCGVNDTAFPQWTAELGLPTGPLVQDADGVLSRTYTDGQVVLNPNRASAARVSVADGLHATSGASAEGGIYVAPETAVILVS
jgi:hypothetical protein